MKRRGIALLATALVLVLVSVSPAVAKKPLRAGTSHTQGMAADGEYLLGWIGTIEGDIDGCIEWWIHIPTWRNPPFDPTPAQASHYNMMTRVYDGDQAGTLCGGTLLLETRERGTTTMANATWRANGTVTSAYGDFSEWIGRRVHESGRFDASGPPGTWTGTSSFRLN